MKLFRRPRRASRQWGQALAAVQEKTPFVVPIAAPAGTFPTKSNTPPGAGKSGSAACAVNETVSPTAASQSAMGASTGGGPGEDAVRSAYRRACRNIPDQIEYAAWGRQIGVGRLRGE